ncbi:putative bifunctional diguanylate cyclase/phosphodiesterase [Sporomusa malonica]|nr:GGDEF domain-containing phosphodiesterase [Sporomusa malonica]
MHSKLSIQVVVAVIICLSFASIQPVLAQGLPADGVVNKPLSLFEPYKNLVNTASVTIIALIITVIYLLININKRRQTERLLQRRNEDLIGVHEELSAQEEELRENFNELYLNEEQIRQNEEIYRLLAEGSNDGLWDIDLVSGIGTMSDRCEEISGFTGKRENFYKKWRASIHPDDFAPTVAKLEEHYQGKTAYFSAEYRLKTADGGYKWVLARGRALFDHEGKAIRIAGSLTDTTDSKLQEARIRQLAYYDPLTGLANRTLLTDLITCELAAASDYGSKGALIFIDIDNFKLVNDTYGHSWGDKLLVDIGGKLSALVGADGVVARLGGDELIVFFPGGGDRVFITEFADKIMKLFEQSITVNQHSFQVTASAGVVMYPDDGSCIDELLRNADTAMYSAKNSGKRNYKFFDKSMFEAVVEKAGMEASLRQAIVNNELIVHYQPQFNLATGRVEGFESLLRWASPEYGLVTPLKFIPLAEETGMIVSIGKWVLQTACVFSQTLFAAGHGRLCTAVNISVMQLIEDDFVEMVAGVLAETGLPPECLELEITESVLMERFEENVRKLGELRRMGVRIALDDFGSGYSSLTYLKKLPITMLKMDKAFIDDITIGGVDAAITGSIIELAHQMGLTVVAEGVETEIQFKYLRQEKCDIIQGYFISRPLPPAEFINELQTCFQRSAYHFEHV